MTEIIEMGTVSSRGQLCIPSNIRESMGLKEGSKVIFIQQDDTIIIQKVTSRTFEHITKPLKEAARIAGMQESDVNRIVSHVRKHST